MIRAFVIFVLVVMMNSKRIGENYIYCEDLDRFKPITLMNALDVLPYILRKIFCVRRKSSQYKLTKKTLENDINGRNTAMRHKGKEIEAVDESGLYLYFTYKNVIRPFFLPKGFSIIEDVVINFKVM